MRVDDAYSYDFRVEPPENTGAQGQVVRRTWEEVHQLAAAMAVRYRLVGPKKPFFDHGRLALAFRSKSILNQLSAWVKSRPKAHIKHWKTEYRGGLKVMHDLRGRGQGHREMLGL